MNLLKGQKCQELTATAFPVMYGPISIGAAGSIALANEAFARDLKEKLGQRRFKTRKYLRLDPISLKTKGLAWPDRRDARFLNANGSSGFSGWFAKMKLVRKIKRGTCCMKNTKVGLVGLLLLAFTLISAQPTPPQSSRIAAETIMLPASDPGVQLHVRNKHPEGVSNFGSDRPAKVPRSVFLLD